MMEVNNNLLHSAKISLAMQLAIGIVGIHGIFISLPEKDNILTDIMILETIVQFIEMTFYIWLVFYLSTLNFDVTYVRYFDWFLSTPIMLISTTFFMRYLASKSLNQMITIKNIIKTNWIELLKIGVSNVFMLLFGFLAEINIITRTNGLIFGSLAFLYTFYVIYSEFVDNNNTNKILFYTMFTIWSLYGVAYMFPYITKNTVYNYLDVVSKNFYGLFIYYFIRQSSKM
jgi:bacteriorhodopsin